MITNNEFNEPFESLLTELQLPSIPGMIKPESAKIVYEALNAEAPVYLTEQFNRASEIANRNLRSSNLNLRSPRLKIKHGKNCFPYRGTAIWILFALRNIIL